MSIRIKNWSSHQHFKDRTPPWIKLYRELLDDPDWHNMDGDSAKVLVGLWLVASEDATRTGTLPCTRKLAFRLRISEVVLNQSLTRLSDWLICDDIAAISPRYRGDAPETETETETETELLCASATAEAPPRADSIPYQAIADSYNAAMTSLPKVRTLTPARKTLIRRAWRADPARQSLRFWQSYFAECQDDPFLSGSGPYREPHASWRPTFEYLLSEKVVVKVHERALDQRDREVRV